MSGLPSPIAGIRRGALYRAALVVCLFVWVLGARWWLVNRVGMDLPMWDQWDGEGLAVLVPWAHGALHFGTWIAPHVEHRVPLTKFVNWAVTAANRQWDQRLEDVVNAVLPASVASAWLIFGLPRIGQRWHACLFGLLAILYGLPFAWENVVNGFHSAQWFLISLSFAAILTLPFARPFRFRWWVGAVCLVLALGSLASGVLAGMVTLGLLLVRIKRGELDVRFGAPGILVSILTIALAAWARVTIPAAGEWTAHSFGEFASTLVRAAGWPAFEFDWGNGSLILWAPWILVCIRAVRARLPDERRTSLILCASGAWVLLQLVATAYKRGAGGGPPPSRYIDTIVFGVAVNAVSALWLLENPDPRRSRTKTAAIFAGLWIFLFCWGGVGHLRRVYVELKSARTYHYYCVENVRNYLATGDFAYLQHDEIPYPDAGALTQRVGQPDIRRLLPVSVRDPLKLDSQAGPDLSGFVQTDSRSAQNVAPILRNPRGVSPNTPVLANAVTWGSFGGVRNAAPARWQSQPIRSAIHGWLKFEVAGQPGAGGAELELRDAVSRQVVAAVRPDRLPNETWRSAYVKSPPRAFVVSARVADSSHWLAFSEPIEMGSGSYAAWRLVRQAGWIAGAAVAGAATLLIATALPQRHLKAD